MLGVGTSMPVIKVRTYSIGSKLSPEAERFLQEHCIDREAARVALAELLRASVKEAMDDKAWKP